MHADAAHLWTVPELAAASGLSRAAFARSFQQALGQPPMRYASPYAFAAAFRRHHGRPPGQWRQRELDRPDINPAAPADDVHTR
jgi:AraC-like DNA-binding protein